MLLVVIPLDFTAAIGFVDSTLHAAGNPVGVHDNPALLVAGGPADGLYQRLLAAQKTLLVGV